MTTGHEVRLPPLPAETTALLVVDLQNDFCHPEGFFARAGHDVSTCMAAARRTGGLLDAVREVGVHVVFTKSINEDPPAHRLLPRRFVAPANPNQVEQGVGGTERFVAGNWGTELVDLLSPADQDLVLEKGRYNAFFGTDLEDRLRALGIDTLAFCGVATNVCVETTARDAYVRGFDVLVVSDCVASFGNEWDLHEAALRTLDLLFGVVAPSDDFLRALHRGAAVSVER